MLSFLLLISLKPKAERLLYRSCPCLRQNYSRSPCHLVGIKRGVVCFQTSGHRLHPREGTTVCVCPLIFLLTRAFCVPQEASSTEYVGPCCRVVAAAWTRRDEVCLRLRAALVLCLLPLLRALLEESAKYWLGEGCQHSCKWCQDIEVQRL